MSLLGRNTNHNHHMQWCCQCLREKLCWCDVMTRWQNDKMTIWQDDKVTSDDKHVTRWQDDKMTRWQGDKTQYSHAESQERRSWQSTSTASRFHVQQLFTAKVTRWQDDQITRWQETKFSLSTSCKMLIWWWQPTEAQLAKHEHRRPLPCAAIIYCIAYQSYCRLIFIQTKIT